VSSVHYASGKRSLQAYIAVGLQIHCNLSSYVDCEDPFFLILAPNHNLGIGEDGHFKFRVLIDTEEILCMHGRLPPKWMCSESRDIFKFWEISSNIVETVQDSYIVATKD